MDSTFSNEKEGGKKMFRYCLKITVPAFLCGALFTTLLIMMLIQVHNIYIYTVSFLAFLFNVAVLTSLLTHSYRKDAKDKEVGTFCGNAKVGRKF